MRGGRRPRPATRDRLPADLAVATDAVLVGGELAQAHRAARVQAVGRDADLRAEAELETVVETRARVPENGRGIDSVEKLLRGRSVGRDDRVVRQDPSQCRHHPARVHARAVPRSTIDGARGVPGRAIRGVGGLPGGPPLGIEPGTLDDDITVATTTSLGYCAEFEYTSSTPRPKKDYNRDALLFTIELIFYRP